MIITRTAKFVNGKLVYDPPLSGAEKAEDARRFAEMVQCRRGPAYNGSDRTFMEGDVLGHGLADMPMPIQEHFISEAKRAGISIAGKVYKGGLADQRGPRDPGAWVGGQDDVLAVAKARDLVVRGTNVQYDSGSQPIPKPAKPLSDKLVAEFSEKYIAADPKWKAKPQELKEMVIDTHGAPANERAKKRKSTWTPPPGWKDITSS